MNTDVFYIFNRGEEICKEQGSCCTCPLGSPISETCIKLGSETNYLTLEGIRNLVNIINEYDEKAKIEEIKNVKHGCVSCAIWNTDACPYGFGGSPDWGIGCGDYIKE